MIAWRLLLALCAAATAACSTPCDRELRITEDYCDHEVAPAHNTGEQRCIDSDRAEARCAVRHKDDYCEWLDAIGDGEVVENDYVRCLLELG